MTVELANAAPARLGRYEVLCELGHGGMAMLYLARAAGIGGFERLFALKMIHPHLGKEPGFVRMFLEEARLAARIRHPNVVPVYEVDVEAGRHYIAMDYLSGETFGACLSSTWPKGRTFPIGLAAYVVSMAAEGLHAAHELRGNDDQLLGVVHRDVTPQNLMLGYDGSVRVMDFGVAKALDQVSHSRPGTFKGTPAYMSPEHVLGEALDRRADTFSLGVILWEATLGKRLFKSSTELKTAARVLKMEVPRPESINPQYPPALSQIVMRALRRERDARYATARALAEDLQQFIATSGLRGSPGELEGFMRDLFTDRLKERKELERKALLPRPEGLSLTRVEDSIMQPVSDSMDVGAEGLAFDEALAKPALVGSGPSGWAPSSTHPRGDTDQLDAIRPHRSRTIALGLGAAVLVAMGAVYVLGDAPANEVAPGPVQAAVSSAPTATVAAAKSAPPDPGHAQPELDGTNTKPAAPSPTAEPTRAEASAEPSPSARPRVKRPVDRRVKVKPKKTDELFDGSDL